MSNGVNEVILIGNCGKIPEMRYTPAGDAVASFSLAIDESYKKDGQKVEKTEWVNIVAWKKLGEICGEYLKAGTKVYIRGRLKTEEYEKDGQRRYSTKVVAQEMRMLSGKPEAGQSQTAAPEQSQPSASTSGPDDDSDIPF